MKNILVTQINGIGTVARGIMLDTLQNILNEYPDTQVYYLSCSNSFNVCHVNPNKIPERCYLCKQGIKKGISLIDKDFIHLKINDITNSADETEASNLLKLNPIIDKNLHYKDYPVGEAAISSYISKSRDMDLINAEKSYIKDLVKYDVIFYSALDRFIKEKGIEKIYSFNGRNSYQKAVLSISKKYEIDCINMEEARPGGYLEIFKNTIPHDIRFKTNLIYDAWNTSEIEIQKRREIGANFFEKKINGERIIGKVFTKEQKKNLLSTEIDYNKKTFVLFTSSDDEFASVGNDYVNPFFKDQKEGIIYVIEIFSKILTDYNLVVRMHPNLRGVPFDYVSDIKALDKISENVHVIFPESPVDTYALLKIAEKVIVFGSSIGIEANYWKKPVILLAKSVYYYMDIAYIPDGKDDIMRLLTEDLQPKSDEDALICGFYFLEGGEKAKYYDKNFDMKVSFKGVNLYKYTLIERVMAKLIQIVHRYLNIRIIVK